MTGGPSSADGIDGGQQLSILPPEARILLDVGPANDAVPIHQEIRPVGVVPVVDQYAVGARDFALEIAQQVYLHAVLCFVFPQRIGVIDADRKHDHAAVDERVVVVAHVAQLGRAGAREGEREKRDQNGFASKRRKGHFLARRRRKSKIRRLLSNRGNGARFNGCHERLDY